MKGADVDVTTSWGGTPLHLAPPLDIVTALIDRGADPTLQCHDGTSPIMDQARFRTVDSVAHLLQDLRVLGTVNVQDEDGDSAPQFACFCVKKDETAVISTVHLLLQYGANPLLTNRYRETPLAQLRDLRPTYHAAIAVLE